MEDIEDIMDIVMNNMDKNPLLYITLCIILAIGMLAYAAVSKFGKGQISEDT